MKTRSLLKMLLCVEREVKVGFPCESDTDVFGTLIFFASFRTLTCAVSWLSMVVESCEP